MITRETVDGKLATVSYLTTDWEPCAPKNAELVKIVFDDGGVLFGTREVGGGSLPDAYAAAAARQTHLSEEQRAALLQRLQADAAAPTVRPTPPVEMDVPESTQTIIVRKAKG